MRPDSVSPLQSVRVLCRSRVVLMTAFSPQSTEAYNILPHISKLFSQLPFEVITSYPPSTGEKTEAYEG